MQLENRKSIFLRVFCAYLAEIPLKAIGTAIQFMSTVLSMHVLTQGIPQKPRDCLQNITIRLQLHETNAGKLPI